MNRSVAFLYGEFADIFAYNSSPQMKTVVKKILSSPISQSLSYLKYAFSHRLHLLKQVSLQVRQPKIPLGWQLSENIEIRYINLDKEIQRREQLEKQFASYGLPLSRFSAIRVNLDTVAKDYSSIFKRGVASYLDDEDAKHRKRGVVGCYLSHLHVIQEISSEEGYTLILEDDILIKDKFFFVSITQWIEKELPEWDVLVFDSKGPWREKDKVKKDFYYPKATYPYYYGIHCYLVRNSSKNKILEALKEHDIRDFDGILLPNRLAIKTHVVRTGLCRQLPEYESSISS